MWFVVPWQLNIRYFEYESYVAEKRSSIMGSAMITAVMLLNIDVICTGNRAYTVRAINDPKASSQTLKELIKILEERL